MTLSPDGTVADMEGDESWEARHRAATITIVIITKQEMGRHHQASTSPHRFAQVVTRDGLSPEASRARAGSREDRNDDPFQQASIA